MVNCFFIFCLLAPHHAHLHREHSARVSWYGEGRRTADGHRFNRYDPTICAHRTLPFGTRVHLRNPKNGRAITCVVHDRGPFVRGRQFDVSYAAARKLGILRAGVARLEASIIARN